MSSSGFDVQRSDSYEICFGRRHLDSFGGLVLRFFSCFHRTNWEGNRIGIVRDVFKGI